MWLSLRGTRAPSPTLYSVHSEGLRENPQVSPQHDGLIWNVPRFWAGLSQTQGCWHANPALGPYRLSCWIGMSATLGWDNQAQNLGAFHMSPKCRGDTCGFSLSPSECAEYKVGLGARVPLSDNHISGWEGTNQWAIYVSPTLPMYTNKLVCSQENVKHQSCCLRWKGLESFSKYILVTRHFSQAVRSFLRSLHREYLHLASCSPKKAVHHMW